MGERSTSAVEAEAPIASAAIGILVYPSAARVVMQTSGVEILLLDITVGSLLSGEWQSSLEAVLGALAGLDARIREEAHKHRIPFRQPVIPEQGGRA